MEFPFHPLADAFPLIEGDEFDKLVADVRANGQHEPCVILDGMILDGRNRYRACRAAGVEPRVEEYAGADPTAFVISKNLHRRHLTPSQRADIAARLANMKEGRPVNPANLRSNDPPPISQAKAAEMLNVSPRLVAAAKKVQTDGVPALGRMVTAGEVAVSAAAEVAELPAAGQEVIVKAGPKAVEKKAGQRRRMATARAEQAKPSPKRMGKGIIHGNEAVNALIRISRNDPHRLRGFQIVADWIRSNAPDALDETAERNPVDRLEVLAKTGEDVLIPPGTDAGEAYDIVKRLDEIGTNLYRKAAVLRRRHC